MVSFMISYSVSLETFGSTLVIKRRNKTYDITSSSACAGLNCFNIKFYPCIEKDTISVVSLFTSEIPHVSPGTNYWYV
jgi:hypothetical protein